MEPVLREHIERDIPVMRARFGEEIDDEAVNTIQAE
jgi:hypothetical protein